MSDFQGYTETTKASPRPDWPIALLETSVIKVSPEFPRIAHDSRGTSWTRCKRVAQFTLKGAFIKEFPSTQAAGDAMRTTAPNIAKVARGEQKTACGFLWRYVVAERTI